MPGQRIRSLRPDWWKDEAVARLSTETRLFALGCVTASDDFGVFRAHPALLKGDVFPYSDSIHAEQIEGWLGDLIAAQVVSTFMRSGQSYGFFLGWSDPESPWYQRVDRPSVKYRYPAPPDSGEARRLPPQEPERTSAARPATPVVDEQAPTASPPEGPGSSPQRNGLVTPLRLLELWREEAPSLGAPRSLTSKREELCEDLVRELGPEYDEDRFRAIFHRVASTPFLCGDRERSQPGAFKASFTWITDDAERVVKVESGHFGDPAAPPPTAGAKTENLPACKVCNERYASCVPVGFAIPAEHKHLLMEVESIEEPTCSPCMEKTVAQG